MSVKKVVLLCLAVLAAILAGLIRVGGSSDASSWHPLPKGGAMRVYAVTSGIEHKIKTPPRPWNERMKELRFARKPQHFFDIIMDKTPGSAGTSDGLPSTALWLQFEGRPTDGFRCDEVELVIPGAQSYRAEYVRGGGGSVNNFVYT